MPVTGGNTTYDIELAGTTYRVHVFTEDGNLTVTEAVDVEAAIVAGGGGGGGAASSATAGTGGGGAGGVVLRHGEDAVSLSPTGGPATDGVYPIVVGPGGAGGGASASNGTTGTDSSAFGYTADGGGHGTGTTNPPGAGGSGGGARGFSAGTGGAGTAGQGSAGGSTSSGDAGTGQPGAGGGGYSETGGAGGGTHGGKGGDGIDLSSSYGTDVGESGWFAGGGRGGSGDNGDLGTPGTGRGTNTGGGGNGGYKGAGTAGDDGIVLVRYELPPPGTGIQTDYDTETVAAGAIDVQYDTEVTVDQPSETDANDLSRDLTALTHWRFESGALTTNEKAGHTLVANGSPAADTNVFREGGASAILNAENSQYFSIAHNMVAWNFPGKGATTFTVMGWFRFPDPLPSVIPLFNKWNGVNMRSFNLQYDSVNKLRLSIGYNSGASEEVLTSGLYTPPVETWLHVLFAYNRTTRAWKLNLWNDADKSGFSLSGTSANTLSNVDSPFWIGRDPVTTSNYLTGHVDETAIFTRVVSNEHQKKIVNGVYGRALGGLALGSDTHMLEYVHGAEAGMALGGQAVIFEGITSGEAGLALGSNTGLIEYVGAGVAGLATGAWVEQGELETGPAFGLGADTHMLSYTHGGVAGFATGATSTVTPIEPSILDDYDTELTLASGLETDFDTDILVFGTRIAEAGLGFGARSIIRSITMVSEAGLGFNGTSEPFSSYEVLYDTDLAVNLQYRIGDIGPAGGRIFHVDAIADPPVYYEASWTDTKIQWGPNTNTPAAELFSSDDGQSNTSVIIDHYGTGDAYAARTADSFEFEGYSDWYLPSTNQITQMDLNLYQKGLGSFTTDRWYWTSNVGWAGSAWARQFRQPYSSWLRWSVTSTTPWVRPVRQFSTVMADRYDTELQITTIIERDHDTRVNIGDLRLVEYDTELEVEVPLGVIEVDHDTDLNIRTQIRPDYDTILFVNKVLTDYDTELLVPGTVTELSADYDTQTRIRGEVDVVVIAHIRPYRVTATTGG